MASLPARPDWLPELPLYVGITGLATVLNIGFVLYTREPGGLAIALPATGIMLGMLLTSPPAQPAAGGRWW